jgi:hypothetical protein
MTTINEATTAAVTIREFISPSQLSVMGTNCRGEDGEWFKAKLVELAETITTMPKTYEQDDKGDDAIAYLHYFRGVADWYITEKDMDGGVFQAFGLAHIHETELGYISIAELVKHGVELDLYFTPKTLAEIKG